MSNLERIKGSIPPVITPIRDGEVDYEAYRGLVEFQAAQGSHGILVNGTTAEPSTLTTEERNRLVDIAVETVDGKIPIVAATGSQSFAETEVLTAHAVQTGVDALLIVTPYYIRPPQRGLIRYYLKLAGQHDTPWMIYHIPGRTAINVTLDSMKEIRDNSPTFVGMKHAVNDLGFVTECLAAFGDDFKIFVGLEEGIDGLVHVSDISWTEQIKHPSEKFKKGDELEAVVLKIDKENEKFSLGIKQLEANPWEEILKRYPLGGTVTGTVDPSRAGAKNCWCLLSDGQSIKCEPGKDFEANNIPCDGSVDVASVVCDEDDKPIAPGEFMPLAANTGVGGKIDRWVILQSIKMLSVHRSKGNDTRLMINLTPNSVSDTSFLPWLSVAIKAARLPSDAVIFQLYEDDAITYLKQARDFTNGLKELHCRASLSHFGRSDNPFGTLKHLNVDFVKIDGTYVHNIDRKDDKREALGELIGSLQAQGKLSIVPMVETAAVLASLWQAGANYIQGNYLQEPTSEMDYDFDTEE